MRVTKVTREYIESQVQKKLEHKYATEKATLSEQMKIRDKLLTDAARKAEQAYNDFMDENLPKCDFLRDDRDRHPYNGYTSMCVSFNGIHDNNSVYNWSRRMRDEAKEIATQIVVTLELGGNKEDLERMLSEI